METNRPADSKKDFGAVANHIRDCRAAAFALCTFAKGRPWHVRMNTMIAVKQLRLLARHDSPVLRENAMRSLARL